MSEHAMQLRGQAVRGVVHGVDDSGAVQTVTVETHLGVVRQAEVHQPFGFSSSAPADGAVTVTIAIGGDQGDPVALPPSNPQAARFAGLAAGETVVYDSAGNRLHFSGGALVDLVCATVQIRSRAMTIAAPDGLTITGPTRIIGDVRIEGDLVVTGDISDGHGLLSGLRGHYNVHTHSDPQGGTTATPVPTD